VGITAGSREVPGRNACDRRHTYCIIIIVGRDSVVGIATRYGLHGLGIESWWGLDFLHPDPAAHPVGTGTFLGVRRPGCGVDHPPQYSAEVKERVEP